MPARSSSSEIRQARATSSPSRRATSSASASSFVRSSPFSVSWTRPPPGPRVHIVERARSRRVARRSRRQAQTEPSFARTRRPTRARLPPLPRPSSAPTSSRTIRSRRVSSCSSAPIAWARSRRRRSSSARSLPCASACSASWASSIAARASARSARARKRGHDLGVDADRHAHASCREQLPASAASEAICASRTLDRRFPPRCGAFAAGRRPLPPPREALPRGARSAGARARDPGLRRIMPEVVTSARAFALLLLVVDLLRQAARRDRAGAPAPSSRRRSSWVRRSART